MAAAAILSGDGRRGDAADALFREMKRQIAEKLRKE
jgi:hypothetical protein